MTNKTSVFQSQTIRCSSLFLLVAVTLSVGSSAQQGVRIVGRTPVGGQERPVRKSLLHTRRPPLPWDPWNMIHDLIWPLYPFQARIPGPGGLSAGGGGGTVISLLGGGNGYVQCEGPGSGGCTTAAINTTGASLLMALDCTYTGGPGFAFGDSKSNAWTNLTTYTNGPGNEQCRWQYSISPVVGSSHTFNDLGASSYAAIGVIAVSGADTIAPFVTSSDVGGSSASSCSSVTPCPPGSVTISTGNIEVTFFEIPFGFTQSGTLPNDTDYVIDGTINSGSNEGFTIAHLIPVSTAARNPAWQPNTGTLNTLSAAASFKHQ